MDEVCPFSGSIQCLGICEITGNPEACKEYNNEPQPLSEEVLETAEEVLETARFQFADEEKLTKLAEGLVPECTARSTKWALENFMQWKKARNSR